MSPFVRTAIISLSYQQKQNFYLIIAGCIVETWVVRRSALRQFQMIATNRYVLVFCDCITCLIVIDIIKLCVVCMPSLEFSLVVYTVAYCDILK